MFIPDSLRDRFAGNGLVVSAVIAPVAWVGLSALFGGVHLIDWIIAAVLACSFAVGHGKKRARARSGDGIYGPPE